MLFDLCHNARSIVLTIYCGRMFREVLWECDLVPTERDSGNGLEGVVNSGLEVLEGGGRFLFRALLLKFEL